MGVLHLEELKINMKEDSDNYIKIKFGKLN